MPGSCLIYKPLVIQYNDLCFNKGVFMKTKDVIEFFGGYQQTALALDVWVSSIYHWGDEPPALRQYHIEIVTGGKLKANKTLSTGGRRERKFKPMTKEQHDKMVEFKKKLQAFKDFEKSQKKEVKNESI